MSEEYYAKLDQRIVYSSMWEEDGDTCKVWITFLALKHITTGIVDKNPTGIARLCNLPLETVLKAIEKFEAPDLNSSSKEHDGRRLLSLDTGGWKVVNHEKYMGLGWSDEKKAYERERKAAYRAGLNNQPAAGGRLPPASARFTKPTREELDLAAAKIGLPPSEVDAFVNFYESKGWMIGKNRMQSAAHALAGWKTRWEARRSPPAKPLSEPNQIQEKINVPTLNA